jgi:uncharacterized lipoprotein YmbA
VNLAFRQAPFPMKSRPLSRSSLALLAGFLFGLAGCNVVPPVQPDLTRYYVLSAPVSPTAVAPAPTSTAGTLRVGLRPVEVAPYLRRNSMVVRAGEHELSFADSARWAEPLDREIGSVLRQRLSASPAVARVLVPPFALDASRDFDVTIQVLHCEGRQENGAKAGISFAATIEVSTAGENPQLVVRKTFVAPIATWDGKDFAKLAASLSDAVSALAQEVVASLPEKK